MVTHQYEKLNSLLRLLPERRAFTLLGTRVSTPAQSVNLHTDVVGAGLVAAEQRAVSLGGRWYWYLVAAVQGLLPQLQLQLAGGRVEVAADHGGLQLLLRLLVLLQLNAALLQVPARVGGGDSLFSGTELEVSEERQGCEPFSGSSSCFGFYTFTHGGGSCASV